jgi:hypothetical protein
MLTGAWHSYTAGDKRIFFLKCAVFFFYARQRIRRAWPAHLWLFLFWREVKIKKMGGKCRAPSEVTHAKARTHSLIN